jgi:hypothetical protein
MTPQEAAAAHYGRLRRFGQDPTTVALLVRARRAELDDPEPDPAQHRALLTDGRCLICDRPGIETDAGARHL